MADVLVVVQEKSDGEGGIETTVLGVFSSLDKAKEMLEAHRLKHAGWNDRSISPLEWRVHLHRDRWSSFSSPDAYVYKHPQYSIRQFAIDEMTD